MVQILLNKGADVNAQGGEYGNALQAASSGGHDQVVQILLDKGADVNAQRGKYGNALYVASSGGHDQDSSRWPRKKTLGHSRLRDLSSRLQDLPGCLSRTSSFRKRQNAVSMQSTVRGRNTLVSAGIRREDEVTQPSGVIRMAQKLGSQAAQRC